MPLPQSLCKYTFGFWITVMLIAVSSQKVNAVYGQSLFWPTPNKSFIEGADKGSYLQATGSGRIESGNWGCSRNNGNKFHEGVDLKSIDRNNSGESKDSVFAVTAGKIVHINRVVGDSNYGKYVVISHVANGLEWCSLYAHLESIDRSLSVGAIVKGGQQIGVMGRTSSNIEIPKSRAHLHFEIVLRTTSKFDKWYQARGYKTANEHGNWNGMNLMGTNPFVFYQYYLDHPKDPFYAYFLKEPVSFEVLVYFHRKPDFLMRNPIFLRGKKFPSEGSWYHIGFTWYGLPVSWNPVATHSVDKRNSKDSIYIQDFKHERSCRNWIDDNRSGFVATNLLKRHIEMLKTGDK